MLRLRKTAVGALPLFVKRNIAFTPVERLIVVSASIGNARLSLRAHANAVPSKRKT